MFCTYFARAAVGWPRSSCGQHQVAHLVLKMCVHGLCWVLVFKQLVIYDAEYFFKSILLYVQRDDDPPFSDTGQYWEVLLVNSCVHVNWWVHRYQLHGGLTKPAREWRGIMNIVIIYQSYSHLSHGMRTVFWVWELGQLKNKLSVCVLIFLFLFLLDIRLRQCMEIVWWPAESNGLRPEGQCTHLESYSLCE